MVYFSVDCCSRRYPTLLYYVCLYTPEKLVHKPDMNLKLKLMFVFIAFFISKNYCGAYEQLFILPRLYFEVGYLDLYVGTFGKANTTVKTKQLEMEALGLRYESM